MSEDCKNNKFKVGEHVVYPLQGVGVVQDIRTRVIQGLEVENYVIYLDISDMTVTVPVPKSQGLGIRPIVCAQEAQTAIDSIKEKYEPLTMDWKQRYQVNVELVKEGSIINVARVVQSLHHRSRVKELPVQERKLYENALRLLIDESSYALNLPVNEVKKMVEENLEK